MKKLKKIAICVLLYLCCINNNKLIAQTGTYDTLKVYAWVSPEGDTLPLTYLSWITVETHRTLTAAERRKKAEWTRLRNAVYVTYPYALAASRIMNEINAKLVGVSDKKDRKAIIKTREKELRKEFADRLTNLSIYQGKVLMKLIYRQSGNSCYEIIKDYKGGFSATFYQTIAIIVGTNLKQSYEAYGKDYEVEQIVQEVERMYGLRG
ncbi:MAG: DUF4294 domain-containing protein [Chitinophagaceae bacterium]|nr:DUF4294 domain-containing protein [Chitinophagaceae bacterium]